MQKLMLAGWLIVFPACGGTNEVVRHVQSGCDYVAELEVQYANLVRVARAYCPTAEQCALPPDILEGLHGVGEKLLRVYELCFDEG